MDFYSLFIYVPSHKIIVRKHNSQWRISEFVQVTMSLFFLFLLGFSILVNLAITLEVFRFN